MASTDHIPGENQAIDTYMEVLQTRAEAFKAWVLESVKNGAIADESDWDEAYTEWMEKVETGIGFGPYTFINFLTENGHI